MSAVSLSLAVARAAESAARAVPGVADLSGGTIGEFSTFGSGERVTGVRVRTAPQPSVAVRLVAVYGRPLPELTDEVRAGIRAAVNPLFNRDDVPVDIDIVDVTTDPQPVPAGELPAGAPTGPAGTSPSTVTTVKAEGGQLTWRS